MRVAILGGGFTGMTAAYDLQKAGHKVTLFEKEPVLGGLAVGFRQPNWEWYLERAYHHLFSNDTDILDFAKEIGFEKIFLNSPETASLYRIGNNYRIITLDSPQSLMKFPFLTLPQKVRVGLTLAFLKASPFFSFYERQTAEQFLKKYMGEEAWNVLWQELFRKKFGKYAENILASFIWARIKKRTPDLAYITGGFQTLIDHIEMKIVKEGVEVKKGAMVEELRVKGEGFRVQGGDYDVVISTLPSLLMTKVAGDILPENYLNRFKKLQYLHAMVLILETKMPLLEKVYWLNISTAKLPVMGVIQHTNLVNKKHYGGNHLTYAANYVDMQNPLIKMSNDEVLNHYLPQLKQINPNFQFPNKLQISNPKIITFSKVRLRSRYLIKNLLKISRILRHRSKTFSLPIWI